MNHRERVNAILHYRKYDSMPVVHFGFWPETLERWVSEGHLHLSREGIVAASVNGSEEEAAVAKALGFDFNWYTMIWDKAKWISLWPKFGKKVVKELEDGSFHMINEEGMIVKQHEGASGIPTEVGHTLVDRRSWEELYLPKLKWSAERFDAELVSHYEKLEPLRETPVGIYLGSLFGQIRNWMGLEAVSYLQVDDKELFDEIVDAVFGICYRSAEEILKSGISFDFAHIWEDICFRNGPLISPKVYDAQFGPMYKRLTELVGSYGIDIVSLDCDGVIDSLIPTWINNGVNTMFPIEVGTWGASIAPWREKYGRQLLGVGGMDKRVFAQELAAVDNEIERLKPLISLGGYIPCPDHLIAPDAKWDNVRYYCDRMRSEFC